MNKHTIKRTIAALSALFLIAQAACTVEPIDESEEIESVDGAEEIEENVGETSEAILAAESGGAPVCAGYLECCNTTHCTSILCTQTGTSCSATCPGDTKITGGGCRWDTAAAAGAD